MGYNIFNTNGVSKYYILKEEIIKDIKSGRYLPEEKLPSEKELMDKYRVARATVERAVNELVRNGYIYTVQGKGRFVSGQSINYRSNYSILEPKRVIFIIPYILNNFYTQILKGIIDVLQPKGYGIEICNSEENYSTELKLISKYLKGNITGLIFVPSFNDKNYMHLFQLKKKGIPIVLVDRNIDNYKIDFVSSDHLNGARRAVKYLIKQGHRNIVFIGRRDVKASTIIDRFEGYKRALQRAGIKINKDLILDEPVKVSKSASDEERHLMYEKEGYEKIKKLLDKKIKFTAIVSISEERTVGAFRALKEAGLKVPDDVSIISFDGFQNKNYFEVPVTVVRQNTYKLGYCAAKILLERIGQIKKGNLKFLDISVKKIKIATELMLGNSVKKVRN